MTSAKQMELPSPRNLLSGLIETLATSSSPILGGTVNETEKLPNPLKAITPQQKALFASLHVLIPGNILLPALDLLDRGLVTKVKLIDELVPVIHALETHTPSQTCTHSSSPPEVKVEPETNNAFYLVRSSQPAKNRGRFKDALSHPEGSDKTYQVRLRAWGCSCAAFAYSVFFSQGQSHFQALNQSHTLQHQQQIGNGGGAVGKGDSDGWNDGGENGWGGMSIDLGGNGGVCKHILACLLAEKIECLEGYVKERCVGRGEMAGLAAEG